MKSSLYCAAALMSFTASIGHLTAQDAAPVDVRAVLTTLHDIQKKQSDGSKADKMGFAQKYASLSRDPSAAAAYYEDAIRATKFEGESREGTRYLEWKNAEGARMHGTPFREGLSLHFLYLSLTMRRSAGAEIKDLLPELINYTEQVQAGMDSAPAAASHTAVINIFAKPGKKGPSADSLANPKAAPPALDDQWVKSPISSSIFVVWSQKQDYVNVEDWEMVPGNVDGIYQKTILPELRRMKDPRVLSYWDMKMQRDENTASQSGRNFDLTKFYDTVKPQLMWNRAQELLVLNKKNSAINDMVAVIKTYPAHPNVPDWIHQVETLVQPPAASPARAAAAPAPAAASPGSGMPATIQNAPQQVPQQVVPPQS